MCHYETIAVSKVHKEVRWSNSISHCSVSGHLFKTPKYCKVDFSTTEITGDGSNERATMTHCPQ